jgi:hypothetical protein
VPHLRIWDVPPELLCRSHLLGEHRELHAIWVILTEDKKGYSRHPETLRWRGKLAALYRRHTALVKEMRARGYRHRSPLDRNRAVGWASQDEFVDDFGHQLFLLSRKGCDCLVG